MTRRNRKKESDVQDVNQFMHEVEEAMHVDAMLDFWNAYKLYIISSLVGLFALVTGYQWYAMTMEKGLKAQADEFYVAQQAETEAGYEKLVVEGSKGFKLLATLRQAQILASEGKVEESVAIYDSIIASDVEADFKELMKFNKAMALMATQQEKSEAIYSELVSSKGVFVMPAREMLGVILESKGNFEKAKKHYQNIVAQPNITQSMRQRVQSRIETLNRKS